MLGQYRKVQVHETHGSWEAVGAQMGYGPKLHDDDVSRFKLTARPKK